MPGKKYLLVYIEGLYNLYDSDFNWIGQVNIPLTLN